jgi:hypothetical protein
VSSWIVVADDLPDAAPGGFSLKLLHGLADAWAKERASMRMVLTTLTNVNDPVERLRYRSLSMVLGDTLDYGPGFLIFFSISSTITLLVSIFFVLLMGSQGRITDTLSTIVILGGLIPFIFMGFSTLYHGSRTDILCEHPLTALLAALSLDARYGIGVGYQGLSHWITNRFPGASRSSEERA